MAVHGQINKLISSLHSQEIVAVVCNGSEITIRAIDDASSIHVYSRVYFGGNFIPKSVRESISKRQPFDPRVINTFISVNEENFEVSLNYTGPMEPSEETERLIEEFSILVGEWRLLLEQNDKNDLIHIKS